MKKVFVSLISIVIIIVLIDLLFGKITHYWINNIGLKGDCQKIEYLFKDCKDNVVILGSSVAINSTDPSILEKELGMTVFNGGCNGQYMPFYWCMIEGIINHHKPNYLLLGFRHNEIVEEKYGRISMLRPYYNMGYSFIDEVINSEDPYNHFLLKSSLYRMNTISFRLLCSTIYGQNELDNKGFVAKAVLEIPPKFKNIFNEVKVTSSTLQEKYFKQIINTCHQNDIKVIVYVTPYLGSLSKEGNKSKDVALLQEICDRYSIPIFDFSQDSLFISKPEWFYDNVHLNKNGARVFSNVLSKKIKRIVH